MPKIIVSMRKLFVAAVGVLLAAPAMAQGQNAVITGRVQSDQGQPLAGANVLISELNISVATNAAGQYTITVPAARVSDQTVTLRTRAIGYTPAAQPITVRAGSQTLNFDLRRDVARLSEVVITGVATATEQRKLAFTVSRLDSAMMPVAGSSALAQLQGKVPGALIVSNSGRPGAAPAVLLRGPVSLNATGRSQAPLFLLDGVPLQGGLPDLNPDDIDNIEIVKGAAAASLYGARAGSGVINITTKTGRNAEPGIRFGLRTETGRSGLERKFPLAHYTTLQLTPDGSRYCSREALLQSGTPSTSTSQSGLFSNCARYIDWDQEVGRINNNADDFSLPTQPMLGDHGISAAPDFNQLTGMYVWVPWHEYRDPVGQVVTPSTYANTNIDIRGRVNNTAVFASVSNLVQQGAITALPGFVRNSVRANIDQTFSDRIRASLQTFFSQGEDNSAQLDLDGAGSGTPWFTITRAPWVANLKQRDQQGRYVIRHNPLLQGGQNANPIYTNQNNRRTDQSSRFVGGASVNYRPLSWLVLDGMFGYDRAQGQGVQMRDRGYRATNSNPVFSAGFFAEDAFDNAQWNTSLNAAANKTFFGDLDAIFSTRYAYSDRSTFGNFLQGTTLVVPGLVTAASVTADRSIGSTRTNVRDMGFFYGLDLDYKDRYILGGLIRRDGSSLFGAGQRWHTFGRVSGAWLVSDEPWWFARNALSQLKLRAAHGSTGQRPSFAAQYTSFTIGTGGTLNPATLGNPNLKPEINTETEIGIDLEFFNRFALNVTRANSVVDNQILQAQPSVTTGFARQWQNVGEIATRAWEAALTVPIINRGTFNWSTRLIYDQVRSKITRLDIPEFTGDITAGNSFTVFKFREGERIGTVYGFDMVRNCSQLPANFVAQCSNDASNLASEFRPSPDGFIAWFGAGNAATEGITRNLWRSFLPNAQAPWQNRVSWGMPIIQRDTTAACLTRVECQVSFVPLGNGLPKYHWGFSQNIDWRRLSFYSLLDAEVGHKLWNIAYHWSTGDLQSDNADMYGVPVEEAKPIGYFWRRGPSNSPSAFVSTGAGGLYDGLNPHGWSFQDATYIKLREISLNYRVGSIGGLGNWRVGVIGRNVKTWTDWKGFDPESRHATSDFGSAILTPINGFRFPNLRTFTLQLSSSF